jgi:hypothetical protein
MREAAMLKAQNSRAGKNIGKNALSDIASAKAVIVWPDGNEN